MPEMSSAPLPAPTGAVLALLRLENLTVAIASVLAFHWSGGAWWLLALLLLVPDVSMIGYMAGPAIGARSYNFAHTYVIPALLGAVGWATGHDLPVQIALIWCVHIGLDRSLNYGLKYASAFSDTHLGSLKRRS